MQRILGLMRKAIVHYKMIENGDKIAVGVSGGKDSIVLALGLARLRKFIGIDFDITAIILDPVFYDEPHDYSKLTNLFEVFGINCHTERTSIGKIVFEIRNESNPCSLCARMRRGALHDSAKAHGCNKVALGHHLDDVVETFFMNLFTEARLASFSPISYLDRKDITLIRPLVFTEEADVIRLFNKNDKINNNPKYIPQQNPTLESFLITSDYIVKNKCPADNNTNRQKIKDFIAKQQKSDPGLKKKIFGAMMRSHLSGY